MCGTHSVRLLRTKIRKRVFYCFIVNFKRWLKSGLVVRAQEQLSATIAIKSWCYSPAAVITTYDRATRAVSLTVRNVDQLASRWHSTSVCQSVHLSTYRQFIGRLIDLVAAMTSLWRREHNRSLNMSVRCVSIAVSAYEYEGVGVFVQWPSGFSKELTDHQFIQLYLMNVLDKQHVLRTIVCQTAR
jgi:hypothetical protein